MTSTFQDINEFGLYKSTNGGTSFTKITSVNSGAGISRLDEINDIDIQAVNNRLWLSTNRNIYGNSYGGRVWYTDDGTNFNNATPVLPAYPVVDVTRIERTEIAPSAIDTDTHYIHINASYKHS